MKTQTAVIRHDARQWLSRFGLAGFLFFLVKGVGWLLVPVLLAWFGAGQ